MQATTATSNKSANAHAAGTQQAPSSASTQVGKPALRSEPAQQALLQAVRKGDTTTIKRLLAAGEVDPNAIDCDTRLTPLMLAACQGDDVMVFQLTRAMPAADVNRQNTRGESALSLAAAGGKDDVVALLLERKGNPELCNHHGRTALAEAAAGGHLTTAGLLIDRGAQVDGGTVLAKPPLALAARRGNLAMVELLLEKKASVQIADQEGWTALNHAASKGHEAVWERLRGEGQAAVWKVALGDGAAGVAASGGGMATKASKTTATTTTTTTTTLTTTRPVYIGLSAADLVALNPEVERLAGLVRQGKLALWMYQDKETMDAIAVLLTKPGCDVVEIWLNNVGVDGFSAALWEALKVNGALTTLDLGSNEIGAAGAQSLLEGLKINTSLAKLWFGNDDEIDEALLETIGSLLTRKQERKSRT